MVHGEQTVVSYVQQTVLTICVTTQMGIANVCLDLRDHLHAKQVIYKIDLSGNLLKFT